jgi:hypothetical protein
MPPRCKNAPISPSKTPRRWTGVNSSACWAWAASVAFAPTLQQFTNLFAPPVAIGDFGLPQEWSTILGAPLKGYASFLGGLQLKHLSVKQIIEPHLKLRGEVRSGIPPAGMWMKMKPTLLVADQIAERLGEKVDTVISAYRSPAYNARCPGASKHSQHMNNVALDLVFASSPRKVAKVAHSLRDEGKFRGGIGLYPDFTHVDTRGTNANWG